MSFSGCLCWEAVGTDGQVGMAFQVVDSDIREFVYDMDGPAFLKRELGQMLSKCMNEHQSIYVIVNSVFIHTKSHQLLFRNAGPSPSNKTT